MKPALRLRALLHVVCLALLSACGGGGGGNGGAASGTGGTTPAEATPASGTYGWLLKAQGATSSLNYGLSLVHPGAPNTEFVIEIPNAAVTDARVLAQGTVNATALGVSGLNPYALLYIVGGDVRRVPLQANGQAPKGQVQSAGTASACAFAIDAVDHAAPESSRFIITTAGADGVCATADDGQAEVRLSASAPGLVLTPLTGTAVRSALRDPSTLAPRGWLLATAASLWSSSGDTSVPLRAASNPIHRVVVSTYRSALVESAAGLSVIDFAGGTSTKETPLAASAAASIGWQGIGHDSQYLYAYRNSSTELSASWQVLRVSRAAPSATVLGAGAGRVEVASLGKDYLYLTLRTPTNNRLLRLNKSVPGAAAATLESGPPTTLATVVTSSADVHQLWRVTGVGSTTPGYTLEMIDETGARLFTSTGGGFPLLLAGGTTLNFDASESRSSFVFADKYGSRFFGDAVLTTYDARTRTATVAGTLPGSADFGNDFVVANVNGGPTPGLLAGFAARSVNGVVQSAGTKVFSFSLGSAASLKSTSRQQ